VFDKEIENYAQSFIFNIRKRCMTPSCKLIGVQVRIGDKLNHKFYDQWSLGEHYFCRAMTLLARRIGVHHEVHFIFFVGKTNDDFISSIVNQLNILQGEGFQKTRKSETCDGRSSDSQPMLAATITTPTARNEATILLRTARSFTLKRADNMRMPCGH